MSKTITWLPSFLEILSSRALLIALGAIFAADVFFPDPLPFVEEIVLGIATLLLARWQQRQNGKPTDKPPTKNVTPD